MDVETLIKHAPDDHVWALYTNCLTAGDGDSLLFCCVARELGARADRVFVALVEEIRRSATADYAAIIARLAENGATASKWS